MQHIRRIKLRRALIFVCLFILMTIILLVSSACLLLGAISGENDKATLVSVHVQQTMLSRDQAALTRSATEDSTADVTPSATATDVPQSLLPPTETAHTPQASPTLTSMPAVGELDERTLKSARILLFEDMSASGYIRIVKEALDSAGYFYLDVGSAQGWFKTQLSSGQEWDLIIAAAEADRNFGGEYFELIHEHIQDGTAAIIEYRDLDTAPSGLAKPLLNRCGVKYQSDWFEPDLRVFFILEPEHPIFQQPNQLTNFRNAPVLWGGDAGDLLELVPENGDPTGDAKLLVSTNPLWKTDHGLLVNCIDGLLTFQTFATHEYQYGDVVALWQNYIYQALKNRFEIAPPPAPTPAITVVPSPTPETLPTDGTPGLPVDPLGTYSCGGQIDARLVRTPQYPGQLFEHHAKGEFMILRLELINQSEFPIQVWDDDYTLEGVLYGEEVVYKPDEAATGYLFIESGGKLYQDRIDPGVVWRTQLAFDVHPEGADFELLIKPGAKFNEQVCEVRIPIP